MMLPVFVAAGFPTVLPVATFIKLRCTENKWLSQQSTKLQEMMRVSAVDKKWRQQERTRYCKDGCRKQEATTRMGSNGKDGRVAMMIVVAADNGSGWRWRPAA
jgi:hypothetical protein